MTPKIARILIKGTSGFCSVYQAYSDKLTVTPDSISYEYKPYRESDAHRPFKWSYRTINPTFRELFGRVAEKVAAILVQDEDGFATDVGPTTFVVTYDDKTRFQKEFFGPDDRFTECFGLLQEMVPSLETVPKVIMT